MNNNIRSFIAIDLPKSVREELYQFSLKIKSSVDELRPTPSQNIHLTLKFLGNIQAPLIEQIKNALDNTARDFKKIGMQLGKIGVFPNLKSPRIFWVAPERGMEEIKRLKEKLDNQLFLLGIEKDEKIFKAHITIARLKYRKIKMESAPGRPGERRRLDFEKIISNFNLNLKSDISIEDLHLYKSTLTPPGPLYTKLHSSHLQ